MGTSERKEREKEERKQLIIKTATRIILEKGVHFIQKPFTRKDLSQKLRDLFDKNH